MPNPPSDTYTPFTSSNHKSIFLHNWWLRKVGRESKLGVVGFFSLNRESVEQRAMRLLGSPSTGKKRSAECGNQMFGSAAIAKRHDSSTLEAVDGITIKIGGCINKRRTLDNGFSPEVCNGFLSGFPCTWEDYATNSFQENCVSTKKQSLPVSFNDLPVTRVRDLLMSKSASRALMSIVFKDILKHNEKPPGQNASSTEKACKNSIETEAEHNQGDVASLSNDSNPTQKTSEEAYKIPVDMQMESSKETEDVGSMLDKEHKVTRGKKVKELRRRYPLRSTRNRKHT